MIELRIYTDDYTGYQSIDLYKDEPIFYELSFAEIQDISKKNSGFTKSFNIPGTTKNNRFFNHFYDPSVVSTSFDTRIKHNASINYNGYEIAVGYIRLQKVTKKKDETIYTIIFYNQVGDLVSKMGDKKLSALVTNGSTGNENFDHRWSRDNMVTSWSINESTPASGLLNGRILYPLLHRGYAYNEIGGATTALEIESRYTGIFNLSGVQPNSVSSGVLPPSIQFGLDYGAISNEYYSPSIQVKSLFKLILNDNNYNLESDFFDNNPWVNRVYLPTTYNTEDFGLVQIPNETWDVVENAFQSNSVTPNHIFDYNTVVDDEYNRWISNTQFTPTLGGWHQFQVEFNVENTGSGQKTMDLSLFNQVNASFKLFDFSVAGGESTNFSIKRWIYLPDDTDIYRLFFDSIAGTNNQCNFTDVTFRQLKSSRYGINQVNTLGPNVRMNEQLGDEISQVDFISSVLKQFNLIMVPKVDDENTLIVEPLKDWVGTGELIDWTTKINRDSPIQITDTTKFVNGVIDLKPKEGKDFLNENYKKENKLLFGQREEALNTDYKQKSTKVQSIFSISQQELIRPTSDYTLPVFYQAKDENINGENVRIYKTFKTTPTLIYYAGPRNIYTDRSVYLIYEPAGSTPQTYNTTWPQSHHLTYYPVVTATQNKSISFNKDQEQGQYKQITVHDDCYTMFYEDMVDDYIDEESRFMSCELYLEPEEVKKLDFSEQIIIDNARWRINKLSQINMAEPSLVKGEFIKLFEELGPSAIPDADSIVLSACGTGDDLYSTTDLNPDLVLLSGYIVRTNDKCYLVNPPIAYNPQLNHQYITLANNNGVPYTYPFCSDCGETGGGLCEPITDINAITGSGGTILGIFSSEDPGFPSISGEPPECIEEVYYWSCNSNLFKVDINAYGSECDFPDGWSNLQGTQIIIPAPIGRPGRLVDECCYDPNTGFNYDIYTELTAGDEMVIHKICCDIQPTTTTSTTQSPIYYYRLDYCDGSGSLNVTSTTALLTGDVYNLEINSGVIVDCFTVNGASTADGFSITDVITGPFDFCFECNGVTTTTTTLIQGQAIRIRTCDTGFEQDVILDPTQPTVSVGDVLNGELCFWNSTSQTYNCYQNICWEVIVGGDVNTLNTAGTSSVFTSCTQCEGTSTTTTTVAPLCRAYEAFAPRDSGEEFTIQYEECFTGITREITLYWMDAPRYFCAIDSSIVIIEPGGQLDELGPCQP